LSIFESAITRDREIPSNSLAFKYPSKTEGLLLDFFEQVNPFDEGDWAFLPIQQIFSHCVVEKKSYSFPTPLNQAVLQTLRFILLLEGLSMRYIERISPGQKIFNLMQIYLVNTEVFLENSIKLPISALFSLYTKADHPITFNPFSPGKELTLGKKYNKFSTMVFHRLFLEFSGQFSSASYGDELFSRFVVLQLQVCFFSFLLFSFFLSFFLSFFFFFFKKKKLELIIQ